MARKKATRSSPPTSAPDSPLHKTVEMAAADAAGADYQPKIDKLKALNTLLIKETMESREQIRELRAQLDGLVADHALVVALEGDVTAAALSAQLASVRGRWSEVCGEREALLAAAVVRVTNEKDEADEATRVAVAARDAVRVKLQATEEVKGGLEVKLREMEMKAKMAEDKLRSAQEQCVALEDESKGKDAAFQSLSIEKGALEGSVANLTQLNEVLRRDMERAVQEKEGELQTVRIDLGRKFEFAVAERDAIQVKLDGSREEQKQLEVILREMEMKYKVAEDSLRRVQEECVYLKNETKDKDEALLSLLTENTALKSRIADLTQAIDELRRDMERTIQEKQEQLQIVRADLEGKVENAFVEKDAIQMKLEQSKEEQKGLEMKLKETEMMVKTAEDSLAGAQDECAALKVESKDKEEAFLLLSKKNTALEERVADLTQSIETLKREMERAVQEKEGELQTVNTEFGRKVEDALAERDAILVKLEGSKEEQRGLDIKLREIVTKAKLAEDCLAKSLEEIAALKGEVKDKDAAFLLLSTEKTALESSIADLTRSIEVLRTEMERTVKEKGDELQTVRTELGRRFDDAVAERDAIGVNLERCKEDQRGLEVKLREMEMKAAMAEDSLAGVQEECAALKDKSKEKDAAFLSLSMEKTAIESRVADLTQSIERLDREMKRAVQEKKVELETTRAELGRKLGDVEQSFALLKQSEKQLLDDLDRLKQESNLLKEVGDSKASKLSELEKSNTALEEAVRSLTKDGIRLQEELLGLKQEADVKASKIAELENSKRERKTGIWQLVSSASTVVAAISLAAAYAAKGH